MCDPPRLIAHLRSQSLHRSEARVHVPCDELHYVPVACAPGHISVDMVGQGLRLVRAQSNQNKQNTSGFGARTTARAACGLWQAVGRTRTEHTVSLSVSPAVERVETGVLPAGRRTLRGGHGRPRGTWQPSGTLADLGRPRTGSDI